VSTIHPVLEAVTDRITERSSGAPRTYSRLVKRKTVDPRAGVSPARTSLHSFLVSPCSRPTLLDAMTDTGLPHLARCGNRL
jgi:hypothetical protein